MSAHLRLGVVAWCCGWRCGTPRCSIERTPKSQAAAGTAFGLAYLFGAVATQVVARRDIEKPHRAKGA